MERERENVKNERENGKQCVGIKNRLVIHFERRKEKANPHTASAETCNCNTCERKVYVMNDLSLLLMFPLMDPPELLVRGCYNLPGDQWFEQ